MNTASSVLVSPPAAATGVEESPLPRVIGTFAITGLAVSVMVGSGIFRIPADIAAQVGTVPGILLVWLSGGAITLSLALSMAELSSMFPRVGGLYFYLREAFGPGTAFNYVWTYVFVNPASWAAIAMIFAASLARLFGLDDAQQRSVAAVLIVAVCTLNLLSLRFAVALQSVTAVVKMIAVAAIALALFSLGDFSQGALTGATSSGVVTLSGFGAALLLVLLPYEGITAACSLAGEVRDPQRTMPRALISATAIVTALYMTINIAYMYVLPIEAIAQSSLVAADAMHATAGRSGELMIAWAIVISTFGTIACVSISDPRILFAPARDGLFFTAVGAVHPRLRTPYVAISLSALLAMPYVFFRSFEQVASQYVLGVWLYYSLAAAGLIWLRRRRPDAARPFRVPLYPIVPVIACASGVALIVAALMNEQQRTGALLNLGLSLVGIPVWLLWRRCATR